MIFSNQYVNRADRNIHILKDTLEILKKRKYDKDGSAIRIKLSRKQMEECHVYLPEDIKENRKFSPVINGSGQRTLVSCRNIDSFSAAEELYRDSSIVICFTTVYVLCLCVRQNGTMTVWYSARSDVVRLVTMQGLFQIYSIRL